MTNKRAIRLFALLSLIVLLVIGCGNDSSTPAQNQDNEGGTDGVSLVITSPQPGSFQNLNRFRVEGTAQGTAEVEVNGSTTSVSGGEWQIFLNFEDGPATVTVRAADTEETVNFFVDTVLPTLRVDTPDRGTALSVDDGETVTITGQVTDEDSGLFSLSLNGAIVDYEDDGTFSLEYELKEGLNVFHLTARDRAQNEAIEYRGLIYGPLTDATAPIHQAVGLDMMPGGVTSLAQIIEAYASPETMMGFLDGGFGDQPLRVESLTWDELEISLVPRDGYLEIEAFISGFHAEGSYGEDPETADEGYFAVAEIGLEMDIAIGVAGDNELDVTVVDSHVELNASDIESNLISDSALLRAILAGAIVYGFTEFVPSLLEENLYDPDLLIQRFEFLDRTIELHLLLEEILITPLGISAQLGLEFPADAHESVVDLPGALQRVLSADTGTNLDRPMRLSTSRTAMDRVLHSVWRSGLFHQRLGAEELSEFSLPFELNADSLASLVDQRIRDIEEPNTPVELRFRPLLPPVMELGAEIGDDSIMLGVGDFLIDFLLAPADGEATHFLTVALYLDVELEVIFEEQTIRFDLDIEADGDIAAEPIFAFDRDRTVNLVTSLLEIIPMLVGDALTIDSLGDLEWASIDDVAIEVNGAERDRLICGLRLSPADDFIEDDSVDN